jgi:dihydropyrimidinase
LKDVEFFQVIEKCKELGALCLVHAENGELLDYCQKRLLSMGITGPEGHYLSRPESLEAVSTHKAISIAEYINSPIYIVHVNTVGSAQEVIKGRENGNVLYGEVIAAALGTDGRNYFSKDWNLAASHVMSPPLNPDPNTKTKLMKYLSANDLQVVSTDNCTYCLSQKKAGSNNFSKIPNGINGIEDRMSIVWTKGVMQGLLSPSDFVRVTSSAAAQIFNLYPKKGVI